MTEFRNEGERLKSYTLYFNDERMYSCKLTDTQANNANKRFMANKDGFIFVVSETIKSMQESKEKEHSKHENIEALKERYDKHINPAIYPYEKIITMVKRYGKHMFPKKALNFGFGAGNHLWMLIQDGYEVWGIERSANAREMAIQNCQRHGFPIQEGNLLVGGIEDLHKLEDQNFDLVIDRLSLAQINMDETKKYVKLLQKKMKNDGIFISLNFSDSHREMMNSSGYQMNRCYTEFVNGNFSGSSERKFYNLTVLKELLNDFKILEIELSETRSLLNKPREILTEIVTVAQKK